MRGFVFRKVLGLLIFLLCSCGDSSSVDDTADSFGSSDWPGWRGLKHDSISLDTEWQPNVLWQVQIGRGYSSIAVQGEYLYCTGNIASIDSVYCLNTKDGQVVWEYSYPCGGGYYPGPRSTPAVDKKFVYTMSRDGRVFCLNKHNGQEVWQIDVFIEFGAQSPLWAFSSSPIIKEYYLILNVCKHGIALNKQNGQVVWASDTGRCGYASPVLYQFNGVDHALFFGETALYGVELESGKLKWDYEWRTYQFQNNADPLFVDNKVFISTSFGKGCALLELTNRQPNLLWTNNNMESHIASFIHLDGYIYGISGNTDAPKHGAFICMDINSGSVMWSAELGMGSIILIGDTFVFLTYNGSIFAVRADEKAYNLLAECRLPRGTYHTSPAYCRNRLYIRDTEGTLYCLGI